MSAMLDTYDMPMVDYSTDFDIQMHPSSSEHWFQDESKMEEDGPGIVKVENYAPLKADGSSPMLSQEKDDVTIEVDMEDNANFEYDMVDDADVHSSAPDILDVEVYDASVAHSPAMVPLDSSFTPLPSFSSLEHPASTVTPALDEPPIADASLQPSQPEDVSSFVHDGSEVPLETGLHEHVPHYGDDSEVSVPHETSVARDNYQQPLDYPFTDRNVATEPEERQQTSEEEQLEKEVVDQPHTNTETDSQPPANDGAVPSNGEATEDVDESGIHGEANSSGDPHEISDGVYIDPPPPVLLSVASEDLRFEHALFNELSEWTLSSEGGETEDHSAHHVLLQHMPTLYYEPLIALFEALRQEDFIQATLHIADAEFVLEAIDLGLTMTEDNIYAREVTIHDLNVLHDSSGITGPLRIRLYTSSPRFIIRYQQLQEHVSQLHLEQPPRQEQEGQSTPIAFPAGTDEQKYADDSHIPSEVADQDLAIPESSDSIGNEEVFELPGGLAEQRGTGDDRPEGLVEEATQEANEEVGQEYGEVSQEEEPEEVQEEEPPRDAHAEDGEEIGDRESYPTVDDDQGLLPNNVNPSSPQITQNAQLHDGIPSAQDEEDSALIGLDVLEAQDGDEQSYEDEDTQADESENLPDEFSQFEETVEGQADGEDIGDEDVGNAEGEVDGQADVEDVVGEVGIFDDAQEHGSDPSNLPTYPAEDADDNGHPEQSTNTEYALELHVDETDPLIEEGASTTSALETFGEGAQDGQPEEAIPDLPTEPIVFEDEGWEDADGEGDPETTWDDDENEDGKALSASNHSSITLSSKTSKRSFDEFESGGEGYDDDGQWDQPSSPDPKRSRTE